MKSCLDKDFVYIRAIDTDIRKTFERIRKAAPQVPNVKARPNHDGSVGQSHSEASLATRLKAETPAASAPNIRKAAQEYPPKGDEMAADNSAHPPVAAPVTQIRRKTCSSR